MGTSANEPNEPSQVEFCLGQHCLRFPRFSTWEGGREHDVLELVAGLQLVHAAAELENELAAIQ